MFNLFRRNRGSDVAVAYRGDLQRTADALVRLSEDAAPEQPYCVANVFPGSGVVISDANLTREQADAVCATKVVEVAEHNREIDLVSTLTPVVMLTEDALLLHAQIMRELQEEREKQRGRDAARAARQKPYDERLAERRQMELDRLEWLAQHEGNEDAVRLFQLSMGINPDLDSEGEVDDTADAA